MGRVWLVEGPMPLIEAPCKVCGWVMFIEMCVIATSCKVQGKSALACIPLQGPSYRSNPLQPAGFLWRQWTVSGKRYIQPWIPHPTTTTNLCGFCSYQELQWECSGSSYTWRPANRLFQQLHLFRQLSGWDGSSDENQRDVRSECLLIKVGTRVGFKELLQMSWILFQSSFEESYVKFVPEFSSMSSVFHYLLILLIDNPEGFEYTSRRNFLKKTREYYFSKENLCPNCLSVIKKSLTKIKLHSETLGNPAERLEITS